MPYLVHSILQLGMHIKQWCHTCNLKTTQEENDRAHTKVGYVLTCNQHKPMAWLICIVYFRYRRKKRNGSENQQSGQKISKFVNDVFIDDYTNIGKIWHVKYQL